MVSTLLATALLGQGVALPAVKTPLVYSSNPEDPWNRIFSLLFTRTITASKTDEFGDSGPFAAPDYFLQLFLRARVSTRTFDVDEPGDRSIEALYPSFITSKGIDYILEETHRRELAEALGAALAENRTRPPLERALMQADLWSAFDALDAVANGEHVPQFRRDAAASLTRPLARLIARLALTDTELAALPDNFARGRRGADLPDLFAPDSPWVEIVKSPHRAHDDAVHMRRASRVFVRPAAGGALDDPASLTGAALVMQTLLVDSRGRVVPTRLFSDVQLRTFSGGSVDVNEFELSRADLRTRTDSGGFRHFERHSPAFFAIAGNDYGFATPERDSGGEVPPLVSTLATRCAACHGPDGRSFMTLNLVHTPGTTGYPVTRLRQPNDDRARFVAREKESRDDFKRLIAQVGLSRTVQ